MDYISELSQKNNYQSKIKIEALIINKFIKFLKLIIIKIINKFIIIKIVEN